MGLYWLCKTNIQIIRGRLWDYTGCVKQSNKNIPNLIEKIQL